MSIHTQERARGRDTRAHPHVIFPRRALKLSGHAMEPFWCFCGDRSFGSARWDMKNFDIIVCSAIICNGQIMVMTTTIRAPQIDARRTISFCLYHDNHSSWFLFCTSFLRLLLRSNQPLHLKMNGRESPSPVCITALDFKVRLRLFSC